MGVRTVGLLMAVSIDGPECVIAIGLLSLMFVVTGPGRAALEHMRKSSRS